MRQKPAPHHPHKLTYARPGYRRDVPSDRAARGRLGLIVLLALIGAFVVMTVFGLLVHSLYPEATF